MALNTLWCQTTADTTGRRVIAGFAETTALGNAVVQLVTLGELESIPQGRTLTADSFASAAYEPHDTALWDEVDACFPALLDQPPQTEDYSMADLDRREHEAKKGSLFVTCSGGRICPDMGMALADLPKRLRISVEMRRRIHPCPG